MRRRESLLLLASSLLPVRAQQTGYAPAVAEWNRPVEPLRIAGNLFYVGAADVSSFLIATPKGHILLDTGFRETVPQIEANFAKLGYRFKDTKLIVASHAHYDHVGGVAEVRRHTGARFLTNAIEAPGFQRGGRNDFAFGDKYAFEPVEPDALMEDGKSVEFGGVSLTPHITPGHTKGCTSWTLKVTDGGRSYDVLIAASLTAPGYQLVNNAAYPQIAADYERSFAKLRTLKSDIFLSFHSWDFDFVNKRKAHERAASPNPFIDPQGRDTFVANMESAFRKRLEEQRAAAKS